MEEKTERGRKPKLYTFNGTPGMSMADIAAIEGYCVERARTLHKKVGSPDSFGSEIFPKINMAKRGFTLNGRPMSLLEAARIVGVSETRIRDAIAEHGMNLTTEQAQKKYGTHAVSRKKQEPITNTAEERAKLAKIPGPTPFELKYLHM